ncbi:MAG: hypothetical protein HQ483_10425 [Rhodospirillales bacterium]|nr:hypothetical protein [Rhodospirillales bacterium]
MRENCAQVRTHYQDAPLIIYDFGLKTDQIAELERRFQPLEVVNWHAKIEDFQGIWESTSEPQKRKLALALNARQVGIRKRLKKALFKRFPSSRFARAMKIKAIRFENLLIQKIRCMRDASDRAADDRLVFLDADALLFQPIDDAFDTTADITLTVMSKISWAYNACFVLNSGVLFFGPDRQLRNRFLDAWWSEAHANDEWLREQSALVRMIERSVPRDDFAPEKRVTVDLDGGPVRLRFVACEEFNFFDMENRESAAFPDSRIYHFTGRRQKPEIFRAILATLRQRFGQ